MSKVPDDIAKIVKMRDGLINMAIYETPTPLDPRLLLGLVSELVDSYARHIAGTATEAAPTQHGAYTAATVDSHRAEIGRLRLLVSDAYQEGRAHGRDSMRTDADRAGLSWTNSRAQAELFGADEPASQPEPELPDAAETALCRSAKLHVQVAIDVLREAGFRQCRVDMVGGKLFIDP